MAKTESLTTQAAPAAVAATATVTAVNVPARAPEKKMRLGTDFFMLTPVVMDTALIMLAFAIGNQLSTFIDGVFRPYPWAAVSMYSLMMVISMYLSELYSFWQQRRTADLMAMLVRSQGLAMIMLAPALYVLKPQLGTWTLFLSIALQYPLIVGWRAYLERSLVPDFGRQRLLIVGSGSRARRIREALTHRGQATFEFVGCTVDRTSDEASVSCRRVGPSLDVRDMVRAEKIDHVVVAQDNPRDVFPAEALLELKREGVQISEGEYFYEKLMGKILTDFVRPSVLIFTSHPMQYTFQIVAKRVIDFVVALLLLIATAPITLLFAALVKLTSKGPVIYSQQRVGMNGENFTIYKFRSMRTDAEKDGIKWASANDDRTTKVGAFMRRTRIDELPQLWNVLKGEMSMVGPRPERPPFVEKLRKEIPFYDMRHIMRPGLSGWAQVRYRYGASIEDSHEKLRYDLYYIKNYSVFLDLTILLETTKVVIFGMGAR